MFAPITKKRLACPWCPDGELYASGERGTAGAWMLF
jgi:hypothetical protein